MTLEDLNLRAPVLAADIASIAEAHGLSENDRARLLSIIAGVIAGNRDRPIFLLAMRVCALERADLFDLIIPGACPLGRLDAALLDFLTTATAKDAGAFEELLEAFASAPHQSDPARYLAGHLSRRLHAYRSEHLPEARHHNLFTAIRRFYANHRPEDPLPRDGDALSFWETEGSRAFLTRYVTALNGLADFADAAQLAASWGNAVALDDVDTNELSQEEVHHAAGEDQFDHNLLSTSLSAVGAAPVKLLLARELDEISRLAAIASAARRWPFAALAALTYGPVQNAITEAARRTTEAPDVVAHMARSESYEDVCKRYALLTDKLLDTLHLIHLTGQGDHGKTSVRSSIPADRRKRIDAMERRKSFTEMEAKERQSVLVALAEPLLSLKVFFEATAENWTNLSTTRLSETQTQDAKRFLTMFQNIYESQDVRGAR